MLTIRDLPRRHYRGPVEIDPGSDMPKPIDQWTAIKAARRQIPDAPAPRSWFQRLVGKVAA